MPDARPQDFVACTVASRRFLAQAAVLADSFFEHHPDGRFAVLIPDDPDHERGMDPRIEVLRPLDIGVEPAELHKLALAYSVKELSCAMKVRLVGHLIGRGDTVVLLDGDLCVYDDLSPVAELARRESLVLTGHCITPHATPDHYPPTIGYAPRMINARGAEQMMILSGTYNTGVVGVGPAATDFVEWWTERTARYCYLETQRGLFQEQGWTALAPMYFPCHVLREHGWNVSGFALHDRDVEWDGDRPRIGGEPLRCFHFITLDAHDPGSLTFDPQIAPAWPDPKDRPGAVRLCTEYAERLLAAGHDEALADESPYDRLPDGTRVDPQMRTAYAEALLQHEAGRAPQPPNPFADGDAGAFLAWLAEPVEAPDGGGGVSRYLLAVHTRLPWVWGAFKDVPGTDSERYLAWLPAAVEVGDLGIPREWLPARPPTAPGNGVDGLLAHIESIDEHRRSLEETIESVRTSKSWRFTAPARTLADGFLRRRMRAAR